MCCLSRAEGVGGAIAPVPQREATMSKRTKRFQNYSRKCGYTWYPQGKYRPGGMHSFGTFPALFLYSFSSASVILQYSFFNPSVFLAARCACAWPLRSVTDNQFPVPCPPML